MSTTFGIFKIPVETDDLGYIISDYTDNDYVEVALRAGGKVEFYESISVLKNFIKEDTKVYPLDNTAQGIYFFKDLLNYNKNETNRKN